MSVAVKVIAVVVSYLALLARTAGFSPDVNIPGGFPEVRVNDNQTPAGRLDGRALTLDLRVAVGEWQPEGPDGPVLLIEAFGETAGSLQVPAPLVRVPEGTTIQASVRNDLDVSIEVHGMCTRAGATCAPLEVPPGARRDARFESGTAGTYHYWATSSGMPLRFRGTTDSQLSGALVVDPADRKADEDRVLVITEWTSLTRAQLATIVASDDPGATFLQMNPALTYLINGRSWPWTERLTHRVGERVRWRVINLSTQPHPMHLHGFYFDVHSRGDGIRDTALDAGGPPHVVTEVMQPGSTLAMGWTPEREGNWLFHCHTASHVSPDRQLGMDPAPGHAHHALNDASAGMAGMVLGVTVTGDEHARARVRSGVAGNPRRLTLLMQAEAHRYGTEPAYGFAIADSSEGTPSGQVSIPGPLLVLERDRPVEIALVNRLPEPTSIHWHGMELESFYDGVHGWSGSGRRVTPLIEPGHSFTVRFTPPRAGTFMYHTHMHDQRQLSSGMYGAMLVLDSGTGFDPSLDHVMVVSRGGPGLDAPIVVNGTREPKLTLKAGETHRLRFVNITPGDIVSVTLGSATGLASWRPFAKDAAAVPESRRATVPAQQTIAAGETFDFEYVAPPGRAGLWLEVRSPAGRWHSQGRVIVK